MILLLGVDKIAERQARLYAGLFVERSDMMPQGADRYVEARGDDLLLIIRLYQLPQHF